MPNEISDLRPTIVPKSDQLNAEQLLGGSMVITVEDVKVGSSQEQPISIHYRNDDGRPFKPCKTMRKVLIHAWGPDGNDWIGKSMELYNDLSVRFGGMDVGGIRIARMSDIPKMIKVSLTATKGKKALHEIARLEVQPEHDDISDAPTVEALKDNFAAAYRSTKDAAQRAKFKARYDARMQALTEGDKLSKVIGQIESATSADIASLVIDAAADFLDEAQMAEAHKAFSTKWESK